LRAFIDRYRPHAGVILCRTAAVILFCLAGANVATAYLDNFFLAVLVGTLAGLVLGLVNDRAAVIYGRRLGRTETAAHRARQAANRSAAATAARMHGDGPVAELAETGDPLGGHVIGRHAERPPLVATAVAASTLAQATRGLAEGIKSAETGPGVAERVAAHSGAWPAVPAAGGSRLVPAGARREPAGRLALDADPAEAGGRPAHPLTPSIEAVRQLRDLVRAELRPEELVGQQGRGVIQLAAELGPRVPVLDAETVVDYITDHVLVAAGQDPIHPERWQGTLDGVAVLPDPTGGAGATFDAQLLGITRAEGDPAPLFEAIVTAIARSGGGLGLAQLGAALGVKGLRVGPYTLAGVVKHLVDQGRLQRPFGAWRYTLTDAEQRRRAEAGADTPAQQRPPLDVVFSVLSAAPAEGMHLGAVAAEVERRREIPCTLGGAAAALDLLVRAGRAEARNGMFFARVHEHALAGPGLTERIRTAVAAAPLEGLTLAELTEAVDADGFGAGPDRVRDMADKMVRRGELVGGADTRYQEPPF
jgi:hypothetical protein